MRATPVRDALYIAGGNRYMSTPGGIQSYYGEMSEMFWAMNFTISFHVLDNLTELFTTVPGNEYI